LTLFYSLFMCNRNKSQSSFTKTSLNSVLKGLMPSLLWWK